MAVAIPSVPVRASRARALLRLLGAAATFIVVGCVQFGQLDPKAQRAADMFECYVGVVEPYLGDALEAEQLIREAIQGKANVLQAVAILGGTADDLKAISASLEACRGPTTPVVAPPVNPRTLASR